MLPAAKVGEKVLIIKDSKVIGKGFCSLANGDKFVSIRLEEGPILDMVKDLESVRLLGMRHTYVRYYPSSGLFFDTDEHLGVGATELLCNTMVVSEFNFGFGICPEHFHNVEGFRGSIVESDESTE